MIGQYGARVARSVALLAEGVDRNMLCKAKLLHGGIALLAEGVDRNTDTFTDAVEAKVALLAEGVDRNTLNV